MSLDGRSFSARGFRRLGAPTRSSIWRLVALASLLGLASTRPGLIARSQECVQPSVDGCPLEIGQRASAVLADGTDVHTWLLQLRTGGELVVALTDLLVDYDVHLYGPDGELVSESLNEGPQDEVVVVSDLDAGEYRIYVNSGRGDTVAVPYSLLAIGTVAPGEEEASVPVGQPESQVSAPPLAPPEAAGPWRLLWADDFSDPAKGLFLASQKGTGRFHGTNIPAAWEYRYADGGLVARILGSLPPGDPSVQFHGAANTPVRVPPDFAVEFRARATKAWRQVVYAVEYYSSGTSTGLRFVVDPWQRASWVSWIGGGFAESQLVQMNRLGGPDLLDEENHLRLEVRGETVTVLLNGREFGQGRHTDIPALASPGATLRLSWGMVRPGESEGEVRFDDFKVYALGA